MDYITGISYDQVKNMYLQNGYVFHDTGKFNVNICGFRNKDLETVDKFNDYLGVAYLDEYLNKHFLIFAGTTKPGLGWLKEKMGNADGTGILCAGQHHNAWELGFHHVGKPEQYEAFVQSGPGVFKCFRDKDQDGKFDLTGPVYTNAQGVNGHHAAINDTFNVGLYSAMCQVWQDDKEHMIALSIAKRCAELYKDKTGRCLFDYTLFQLQ